MAPADNQPLSPDTSNENQSETSHEISPQLVKEIADRVYTLLQTDLRIEFERRRFLSRPDDH
ncbi:MAG TPA: hypothetical protein VMV80_00580 [Anaerolineales bacterium]|nr:hypothetical protein [Anaerolineales bacterium]